MEDEKGGKELVLKEIIAKINEISLFTVYRPTVKKEYSNLARRLKLLIPMFEEIKESDHPLSNDVVSSLVDFSRFVSVALDLLRFGSNGSKIFLALEREQVMAKFHEVTSNLEQALDGISYENLDISDEVKEQVELVISQFKRAKERVEAPDNELYEDLLTLYESSNDATVDPSLLRRVGEKLQLLKLDDLTQESVALTEMIASNGELDEKIEKMYNLLRKVKGFAQTENPDMESSTEETSLSTGCSGQTPAVGRSKSLIIPDDFRCPISLELMKDPVIVSSGQTYERSCIEKWIAAGHNTCPKTQQTLQNSSLTPNYVLRSLIAQWCEANGVDPPMRPGPTRPSRSPSACSLAERSKIEELLQKLHYGNPEDQRAAAGEIRLLAKRNADNRVAIAEAGAIPLLVGLLSTADSRTQEHAVTALLNLSICDDNKGSIINSGAVPGIVHVLKKGSMEARENAAATLFSLSVVDENKATIGSSGAISPLVLLLSEGNQRGKKDAATALFNLCIYQGNKGRAIRAGIVPILMRLLTETSGAMLDESLAILAIISSHPDGKAAIGSADALPVLVEVIGNGSPRNKENAAAVLVHLCSGDSSYLAAAQELGITAYLLEMAQTGTERGRRKAQQLLERINRYTEQQKQVLVTVEAEGHEPTVADS
ncbi:U-box domain-containing protein 13-like [Silene latifolia]|uniref:U-box domain-containing protein 13-like n=1 Tax=Silene latifolia TaxID=37657 RepID=UPI003D76DB55